MLAEAQQSAIAERLMETSAFASTLRAIFSLTLLRIAPTKKPVNVEVYRLLGKWWIVWDLNPEPID